MKNMKKDFIKTGLAIVLGLFCIMWILHLINSIQL